MRLLSILFVALAIAGPSVRVGKGQEPSEPPAQNGPEKKIIATVLGKALTEQDIKPDKTDKTELRDFRAIAGPILGPLSLKYIKDHKLEATDAEIAEFVAFRGHKNEDRLSLLTEEDRKAREEVGQEFIVRWKFNRALFEKYGGRVIFQQAGLEPLDAYRDWLREEQKAGNFRIDDPKWEEAFWEYYKPRCHRFVDSPDAFKAPFWSKAQQAEQKPQAVDAD
jgi:hypothetical protein